MAEPAERVLAELGRIHTFFPILQSLGNRWAARRPWEGQRVGLHMHLTSLTAAFVSELVLGGGSWAIAATSGATTDQGAVTHLRRLGVQVYAAGARDGLAEIAAWDPHWFLDVNFGLGQALLRARRSPRGGVELSRNGVQQLRALDNLHFPVVNADEGRLKPAVENRHGVGESIWHAFSRVTGIHLAGHRVVVVGYGPVGAGVAAYARARGASVEVVELAPVRRLVAHYDGYPTPTLSRALQSAQVVVTATGRARALPFSELKRVKSGCVLLNAGRGDDELDLSTLRQEADAVDHISRRVVKYRLPGGPELVVLTDGHPLNIVLNAGSPEPVLLHFAVAGLALEWLSTASADQPLSPGEHRLAPGIEEDAARLALHALGQEP